MCFRLLRALKNCRSGRYDNFNHHGRQYIGEPESKQYSGQFSLPRVKARPSHKLIPHTDRQCRLTAEQGEECPAAHEPILAAILTGDVGQAALNSSRALDLPEKGSLCMDF